MPHDIDIRGTFINGRFSTVGQGASSGVNQFPAGYYKPAVLDMVVVRPRPDADVVGVISYDHSGHVGIEKVIKITIKGGSYPFYLENVNLPTGATVGATFFVADYLVFRFTPAANGSYPCSMDVVDQDGNRITRSWTIVVNAASSAFVAPAPGGNDTTGDGSFDLPYLTIEKAFDVVAGGKTLYLKDGIYNLTSGSLSMSSTGINSICAVNSRAATISGDSITTSFLGRHFYMNSPNTFIVGLRFVDPSEAGANPRWFSDEGGNCSNTWMDDCYFDNDGRLGTDNGDNVSCFFLGGNANEPGRRHYAGQTRCDFVGFAGASNGWSSIDMYITENFVIEEITFSGQVGGGTATAGTLWPKGAANKGGSIRNVEFLDQWSGSLVDMYVANIGLTDNVTGNIELCYCKIRGGDTATDAAVVFCRGSQDGARLPLYSYRNTIVGRVYISKRDYTINFSSDSDIIIHNHTNADPHKIYVYDPNDADNVYRPLSWMPSLTASVTNYELHLTSSVGVLDSNLELIGVSRDNHMGQRGSKIYNPLG